MGVWPFPLLKWFGLMPEEEEEEEEKNESESGGNDTTTPPPPPKDKIPIDKERETDSVETRCVQPTVILLKGFSSFMSKIEDIMTGRKEDAE